MPSNVDQLREKNTLVLKYVFISSLAPDLSLIPKSMPDKIIILGFFKDEKFVAIGRQEQNHFKGDWNMNIGIVSEKLDGNTLKWVPIYFFELGNVKVLVLTF